MQKTIKIISKGWQNPRFYIEALNLKWLSIHVTAIILSLILAMSTIIKMNPFFNELSQNMTEAIEYVPDYTMTDGQLNLSENQKALYYDSALFKLILDDSVAVNDKQVNLTDHQQNIVTDERFISLYMFHDVGFLSISGQSYSIPNYNYILNNPHRLKLLLSYIEDNRMMMVMSLGLSLAISYYIFYWIQMLFTTMLAGIWNRNLTRSIPWRPRLKLISVMGMTPVLGLELISYIFPSLRGSLYIIALTTLITYYYCLRNHTRFIHKVMSDLDIDIESLNEAHNNQNSAEQTNNKDKSHHRPVDLYPKQNKPSEDEEDNNNQKDQKNDQ